MHTLKKTSASMLLLALTCIAGFWIGSCKNKGTGTTGTDSNKVTIEIPKDNSGLDTFHHFISERQAEDYEAAFRTQRDNVAKVYPSLLIPDAEAFNKRALLSLLKARDCVGLRIFHGVKSGQNGQKDEIRLVIVGVDSKGNDIFIDDGSVLTAKITGTPVAAEHGQCPTCQAVPK